MLPTLHPGADGRVETEGLDGDVGHCHCGVEGGDGVYPML